MPRLRRDLGFLDMVALAVSMMLGIGIFFGPSLTAREFPDAGAVLALWALGGAVAITGAWVFGRLAALYPLSGGPYVYLREAFGPLPAFLFAWTSMVVIGPTGIAVLASLFAANVAHVAPLSTLGLALLALWSIAAFAFVNIVGVKAGGRAQTALTLVKVALIAGLVALLLGAPPAPSAGLAVQGGGGRLSAAFVGILFAFGGWEMSALASEEVREARRTVPRAMLAGAALVTVAYLAATAAYLVALGPGGVASAQALAPEAAQRVWPAGAAFVAVAVALSAAGTINALTLLVPRATYALARDGLFPRPLARLAPRWGTPAAAILLQVALASAYLLTGAFETIATYDVTAVAVMVVLTALTLPALRKRAPAPRALVAAAFAVAALYAGFLALALVENTLVALVGLGLVASGLVPYALARAGAWRKQSP